MRVIVCENYEEMSKEGAKVIASVVTLKPNAVLGLATGSTPIGVYDNLAEMYKNGDIDFSEAISFNLDEYYPISNDNDQSYHYFMKTNLFDKVNIKESFLLDGETKNAEEECRNYSAHIDSVGGIDVQILGIGNNGHIAFNEPDEELYMATHVTSLTESTINANARFFASADDVPKHALTMGMADILKAKTILMLISGKAKHAALSELLNDKITTKNPSTLLKVHPNVIVICDKDAYNG